MALTLVIVGAATGYDGNASKIDVGVAGNPRCPAGTAAAGSIKIDGSQLQPGDFGGRIRITARGGDPDAVSWQLIDNSVEVMAVIVKGGDLANIYYYDGSVSSDNGLTPPLNNGGQAPQISHVEFCFDPKEGPTPTLTVEKTASGTSSDPAQLGDRQAGQGGGRVRRDLWRQRLLNLADGANGSFTWKVTVTHSQAQTYAVTGRSR